MIALVRIHASTAQFPTECMEDTANLEVKKCCSRDCGSEDGRGTCGSIDIDLPTPPVNQLHAIPGPTISIMSAFVTTTLLDTIVVDASMDTMG